MERIDVALIGAGRMGHIHGSNAALHPGLRLKSIVETRPGAADDLCQRFGAALTSLDEVLADPAIGGVLVCSVTSEHLDHALAAAEAGKAVFCEKPIDLDLQRVLAARPRFEDARFLLGFNRRFDPHFLALREKLRSGAVGRLESLHLINFDPESPPPGFIPTSGGLFKDFTIHDLDMARWLLDEEPASLYASASCLVDPMIGELGDVDTSRVVLRTASGRLCVISNTRRSGYGYDQRIEAYCSGGLLCAGNPALDTVQRLDAQGSHGAPIHPGFAARYADAYRAQMHHFADVLGGRADAAIGYDDGVTALVLAEACDASMRSGQAITL